MTSEPGLRIPKIQMAIELALLGQQVRMVEVFMAEHLAREVRPQRLSDLLESDSLFLPALERDGSWSAVSTQAIVWASIALSDGFLPVEEEGTNPEHTEPLFDERAPVIVSYANRPPLKGDLLYSAPPGRRRVVDHLNEPGRFFRLWTADRLFLVSKGHVLQVSEGPSKGRDARRANEEAQ